ncbi:MAG: M64 family metallopeptidase [Bacteroidota bacterium]|nr:M64 family metallopeptidase [Bacteroidota bacterium]
MKHILFIAFILVIVHQSNAQFSKVFETKTLRLDYYHCGNVETERFFFDELIQEPYWAGSQTNLIDTKGYGNQLMEVHTVDSGELIYSRGYSTLFDEWQSTPEAKTTGCCYPESVIMPFPREKVVVSIQSRNRKGIFEKKFEYAVDPKSHFIKNEQEKLPVFDVLKSGNPATSVDIVLLPEGYTKNQEKLFKDDCLKFAEDFFSYAPYSENKKKFNIRGVWSPSKESGPDIPGDNIWNKTLLNSSYYTFDSERYLMVKDFQGIRDLAGNAPYDYIYILANTDKYGGGAIYNFYGISAAHHVDESGKIYIHEFGHLFAGLADEYVGGVEYSEFYPSDVEPWEPNLTTLVDFGKKWKSLLPEGPTIPTPVLSENYEKLGIYEGGGYVSKGIYRPWINCLMNNLHRIDVFCPVCSKSIQEMIDINCE